MGDLLLDVQAMIAGNQQIRSAFATVQAERDQLRAEVDRLRKIGPRVEVGPGELMRCPNGHLYLLLENCPACAATVRAEAAEKELAEANAANVRLQEQADNFATHCQNACDAAEAAEALVDGMRGALLAADGFLYALTMEYCHIAEIQEPTLALRAITMPALAATPAQHAARIQAEALREAAEAIHERIEAVKPKAEREFIAGLHDAKEILWRMIGVEDHIARGGNEPSNG